MLGRDSVHLSHSHPRPSWLGAREVLQTQVAPVARSSTVKEWRTATGHVPQHTAEASVSLPRGPSNACSISPLEEGQLQLAGRASSADLAMDS